MDSFFSLGGNMKRRNFLASVASVLSLAETVQANQDQLKKNGKSAILLWMGGGPSRLFSC